jgi:hypothetical protein
MNCSLEETLKAVVEPYVSSQLISLEHFSHIGKNAAIIPSAVTSFFGFECRLAESIPKADFLLCTTVAGGGRDILAGYNSAINLPEDIMANTVWKRIRDFSLCWANPESLLYEKADNIWLEFDVDGASPEVPIPSFFFGPKGIQSRYSSTPKFEVNADSYEWVTTKALNILLGRPIPLQVERNLFNCFNLLPTGAQVFQMGVMLARRSDTVRICVRGISTAQILEYLSCIGWAGEVSEVKAVVSQLSSFVERIDLDLDIGEVVFPKIGMECYFNIQPPVAPKLRQFLDYLVETGLCLPDKRDALLTYPGYSHERSNPELWPSNLLRASSFLGPRALSMFIRRLHHIKIVYQPGRPLEAKAYLSVVHNWIPIALLQQEKEFQNASI